MIVIPMAGLSSRFTHAGYKLPKYMLPLGSKTVFDRAVESFSAYFASMPFLFIARGDAEVGRFVAESSAALGVRDVRVHLLRDPTKGQAETVELGLRAAGVGDDTPITIFNIDTFRPAFRFPDAEWWQRSDGYLEVFKGSGANWSYVRPMGDGSARVAETTEKRPVSDLCCTGLYHFAAAGGFHAALACERAAPSASELYVAPLYNHMIAAERAIHYQLVPGLEIVSCGVPSEYEAALATVLNPQRASG